MILTWLGFSQAKIDFSHAERHEGESAYTFGALVRFAFEGLFFQTATLLRWIVYGGIVVSGLGLLLAGYFVARWFVGTPYPGWTSLAVLQLLVGGFIVVSTGVAGLYVGKIFNQVKDRPLFVVDEMIGSERLVGADDEAAGRLVSS